jgi:hypothetical protein
MPHPADPTMHPQPMIAVRDMAASRRRNRRAVGCGSGRSRDVCGRQMLDDQRSLRWHP